MRLHESDELTVRRMRIKPNNTPREVFESLWIVFRSMTSLVERAQKKQNNFVMRKLLYWIYVDDTCGSKQNVVNVPSQNRDSGVERFLTRYFIFSTKQFILPYDIKKYLSTQNQFQIEWYLEMLRIIPDKRILSYPK